MSKLTPICALILARSRVLAFAACILFVSTLPVSAGVDAAAAARADKPVATPAAAPLKVTFKKDASGKNEAPMILILKNESKQALSVSGTVAVSVVVHNRPKTRAIPVQSVAAGAEMKIDNLAAEDKVVLETAGFAPLTVVVPYKP